MTPRKKKGVIQLPPWVAERAEEASDRSPAQPRRSVVPLAPSAFDGVVTRAATSEQVRELVDLARQRPVRRVALDFEYKYSRPGVFIRRYKGKDIFWHDPKSVVPLLLGLALAEGGEGGRCYRFSVDCRDPEAARELKPLLELPVLFVAHHVKAELFCLWRLGLPEPARVWDTMVAEKAMRLGLDHARYRKEYPEDELEEAEVKDAAAAEAEASLGLAPSCRRRGVPYRFEADKDRFQRSFLTHPDVAPFADEQVDYNVADAEAALGLWGAQVAACARDDCLHHLVQVEMPWAATNARIEWDGVRLDRAGCETLLAQAEKRRNRLLRSLRKAGLENPNSHPQLKAFFGRLGVLESFRKGRGHSFDEEHLEAVEGRIPAARRVRKARKLISLLADRGLRGELTGSDGRLHPEHRQLGAESGRNSMRNPNVGGIGRAIRPVVVPDPGCGIGEVDLSQIEAGIAGAVYGDPDLVRMFNAGDVYSQMAKSFASRDLTPEDLSLPDPQFKKLHRELRDRMKVFTLATIYNIGAASLAARLGITRTKAERDQGRFMAMFPALQESLRLVSAYGALRGHVLLCSGLARLRARAGAATAWEVNWMRNSPVQGAAAIVFKDAGNVLRRRFAHLGARIILPMHDAFVFEAPLPVLGEAAALTAEALKGAVQKWFPELVPQVDVNIESPGCWNKDGDAGSIRRWLEADF